MEIIDKLYSRPMGDEEVIAMIKRAITGKENLPGFCLFGESPQAINLYQSEAAWSKGRIFTQEGRPGGGGGGPEKSEEECDIDLAILIIARYDIVGYNVDEEEHKPKVLLICECGYGNDGFYIQEAYAKSCMGEPPPICPKCASKLKVEIFCEGCDRYVNLAGIHHEYDSGGCTHTCSCGYDVPSGFLGHTFGLTGWCHRCAEDKN